MVGGRPAHHGLVEVVARGELVGQPLEKRRVTVVDVEERHRVADAVVTRREADVHEGVEVAQTAARICRRRVAHAAVRLLPHLVETMDRVACVGVVRHRRPRELKGTIGQARRLRDPRVDGAEGQAGGTGREQDQVCCLEVGLGGVGGQRRERRRRGVARRRVSAQRVGRRQDRVRRLARRANIKGGLRRHGELGTGAKVSARRTIAVDDAPGEQVGRALVGLRAIGAEDVVVGAILGDDDDDVLDRSASRGARVLFGLHAAGRRQRRRDREGKADDGCAADHLHTASWVAVYRETGCVTRRRLCAVGDRGMTFE